MYATVILAIQIIGREGFNKIYVSKMNKRKSRKKFKYIEHLSDIGIEFYGDTMEEMFENAAAGMFSVMCDLKKVKPSEKRNIKISGKDFNYEDLLILWLEKLLYQYEIENMLFSEFKVEKIAKKNNKLRLEAEIFGEKIDLSRHKMSTAVKAPTYHTLGVKKDTVDNNWKGRVIFDV